MKSAQFEHRADIVSYLGMAFVAGWVGCQSYYHLTALWGQRNVLVKEVQQVSSSCNELRRHSIAEMLRDQDEFGKPPDWSTIKTCPKAPIPVNPGGAP